MMRVLSRLPDRLGGADFWRPAVRLAVPVALQNLLTSSFGMVDTLMLGKLGDVAVASVGMAAQWAWLLHIFFYGMSSGAAVFLAKYWGARDMDGIRRSYGVLSVGCLSISAVMFLLAFFAPETVIRLYSTDPVVIEAGASYLRIACFSYAALALTQIFCTVLRSTEVVNLPLYASICGVALNAVLNYGLIFGAWGLPEMGVRGAAVATVVSSWSSPLVILGFSWFRRNVLICPLRSLLRFNGAFVRTFIRVSIPALLNEGLWALGTTGYNMVFGRMGTSQYAALTIFRTIEGMFFAFYVGICHASGVLVGRELGAGRTDSSILYATRFTAVMPIVSVPVGVIMILTRGAFLGLFDVSQEVSEYAKAIMLIYACEVPIRNISYITVCGVFRPGGDTRVGVLYDIISVWCIALPVTALCGLVLRWDFLVVYLLMLVCEDWVKAVLCLRRLLSLKWIKPVVDGPKV